MKSEDAPLTAWGWSRAWEETAGPRLEPGQAVGRVTAVTHNRCLLRLADGERSGELTGKFRHEAGDSASFPVVGDWAVVQPAGDGLAMIHGILPRRAVLSRKTTGEKVEEQVLAANVDTAFIITAFDLDFNPRRLERYAVTVRESGIEPVILLNKADLAGPEDGRLAEAHRMDPSGIAHRLSAKTGEGIDVIRRCLADNKTGVFLGSSGVGKSTLLNALLGEATQKTLPIRISDGRGRHATTRRQMFLLPGGGLVIDTPGLREIQLWATPEALNTAFSEIDQLAAACRYTDCRHLSEPGCAVKEEVETGTLPRDRYAGYLKLQKEVAHLHRKRDPVHRADTKRRWKNIASSSNPRIKTEPPEL